MCCKGSRDRSHVVEAIELKDIEGPEGFVIVADKPCQRRCLSLLGADIEAVVDHIKLKAKYCIASNGGRSLCRTCVL